MKDDTKEGVEDNGDERNWKEKVGMKGEEKKNEMEEKKIL